MGMKHFNVYNLHFILVCLQEGKSAEYYCSSVVNTDQHGGQHGLSSGICSCGTQASVLSQHSVCSGHSFQADLCI